MNRLAKLAADAENLAAKIKSAVDKGGPNGKKITPEEWGEIIKAAGALLGDLLVIVPTLVVK